MRKAMWLVAAWVRPKHRAERAKLVALAALALSLIAIPGTANAQADRDGKAPPVADTVTVTMVLDDVSKVPGTGGSTATVSPAASFVRRITNSFGGQCLDGDRFAIPTNGARVQLWQCNGLTNQVWILTQVSSLPVGYYWIQNSYGGQCLDGDRFAIPTNGARVQLWECNGFTNQVWIWTGARFVNYYGGQCLDGDRNAIPTNGATVHLWACNGFTNQNWILLN